MRETVIVLDFGGQYNQLIARRVREAHVYAELLPYDVDVQRIKDKKPIGIIFTGGPKSVYEEGAPVCDTKVLELGIPILGICYGSQLISMKLGGHVASAPAGEYGKTEIQYDTSSILLKDMDCESVCWMSHMDYIDKAPNGFDIMATTGACPVAAFGSREKKIYGVQFHPEVQHTVKGQSILEHFLYDICGAKGDWDMNDYAKQAIEEIREKVGDKKVLLALSGGVDSSVCAVLLHKAIGKNLTCVFVDTGLMRKYEPDEVEDVFKKQFDMNLVHVKAEARFLEKLAGVTEPEKKRKIIGEEFIRVFEEEAKKIGKVHFLAQGTIYPDVVESGVGDAALIKSHHNVGGLPDHVDFDEIIEPLRELFKDEVRELGEELGLPRHMVWRQPFPGPGLAIRVIGEITKEKLDLLRDVDFIFRDEIAKAGLDEKIWQYFAVLTDMRSVGVMGDERTYDYTVALRGVTSVDAMTADWARIPYDVLGTISNRIINEVPHINRIVYDITSKPPATIEWE
ncbi:glutamine-hydrolyzing GMP synthase [Christensenella tenuis]|uniref:GMP synthase [glutamine-hydrolyzing] n=1 Tax=Christensenella tenuis TaxID=2763033 RepID=A0ABR7EB53_9FIRM|nr:glutamine-hydrolyzing GMP synthase [Christensenella tenuis]MBC5646985.1 glutamine-hydrolyzing GMP synthase [Christensenella tenuis]